MRRFLLWKTAANLDIRSTSNTLEVRWSAGPSSAAIAAILSRSSFSIPRTDAEIVYLSRVLNAVLLSQSSSVTSPSQDDIDWAWNEVLTLVTAPTAKMANQDVDSTHQRHENTIGIQISPIASDTWEDPEMRAALAAREVSSVYRLLRRTGVSQRQIAAMTGQSQSEVSEILKGRQVMAYDVLAKIADGLGVPRGHLGLAYDMVTAVRVAVSREAADSEESEEVKRREFLAHAAAMAVGANALDTNSGSWVASPEHTPGPGRIGITDVRQVEAATRALRSLNYHYGAGFCRDAVVAQLSWGQQMLNANGSEHVKQRLHVALADLHNLAGWTSFDIGLTDSARTHFDKALELHKKPPTPSQSATNPQHDDTLMQGPQP